MPKVRFCPQCSNNFSSYTYVSEENPDTGETQNYLVYSCQTCLYQERLDKITDPSEGVLFTQSNDNKQTDREIVSDMCLDSTLPRTRKVTCPNGDCPTNKEKNPATRDVVFFQYDKQMKLAYICCVCRSHWRSR